MEKYLWIICLLPLFVQAQDKAWQTYYEKSGYMATPDYEQTIVFCKKLDSASPMMHYATFGKSPQGHDLPLMIIDRNGSFIPEEVRESGKAVLFIEAGIHSGEIEGKDAMFLLLRDMVIHDQYLDLLDHVSIVFIPVFNVDGHKRSSPYNRINQNGPEEMGWRTTATNLNLNRDFLKIDAPEMAAWHQLFQKWLPDFFIDIHTTDGADYQYMLTYVMEIRGNMDEGLTQWAEKEYIPEMIKGMEEAGFPVFEYVAFRRWFDPRSGLRTDVAPPRLSQGYMALQNRPGLLVETHMLKPYKDRVSSTLELIKTTLEFINEDYEKLLELNRLADQRSANLAGKKLPVKFTRSEEDSVMVDFLGVEYDIKKSELTGGDWFIYHSDRPATYTLPFFNKVEAETEIKLPYAYIVPVQWKEVIDRLKLHGVEMDTLPEEEFITVETYKFKNPQWRNFPYEGRHVMSNIDYDEVTKEMIFPAGSVVVPVNQRAARVVAHALEPKAEDSFVYWGFFDPVFERKEYFETYVMEPLATEMIKENPELEKEFKAYMEQHPGLKDNQWGQLWWFYERSPYYDKMKDIYPVGRIIQPLDY
ncbi:MAG: hypothetical protein K9G67_09085 [Bacteroidales bacterium]|nr:hypothetical protein [Bacteroidales bacterium]MCF8343142.1 hypothetical protein [Bacteroidales bacterium]MCF8351551.1 hypothetical protein [Bacteroidales bacterium]MCF8376496.1 hypothetical protein [Bacteroidales bacterium]MCF8401498.1 hypothetical protein [Bacteroidales bacterium]